MYFMILYGPDGLPGKEAACNARDTGDVGLTPGSLEWATHSSILAWRIPRTEELGGLQSLGLQRVRCD